MTAWCCCEGLPRRRNIQHEDTQWGTEMLVSIESTSRASYIQRSMWASAQRYRRSPLNVMILAWRVQGPLRVDHLQAAMDDVVARHPTLRARLAMRGGQLFQEVMAPGHVAIKVSEVSGPTIHGKFAAALDILRVGGRQGIDVVAGPPLDVRLLQLGPDDHILCLYVHHAMCDGWSSQIIVRDLAAFYVARSGGRIAELPPLAERYADVAESQIKTFESGGYADEISYWKAELAGLPPMLALPATGARKGNRDFLANSPVHAEPLAVLTAIRDSARKSRVSAFSMLLAGLSVLLHQRTGAEDLVVGVPTLNRWSSGAMTFVGCATSLLPARIRPRLTLPFDELCVQVHATVRRLLAYGRVPLEVILRETQDSPVGGPVFPVWCQIREAVAPILIDSVGLSLTSLLIERGTLLADLDVDMLESDGGLLCEFAHRSSLFERAVVEGLMADYGAILRAATQQPHLAVAELCRRAGTGGQED